MSSQPPMGGHSAIPQNGISYVNESPMRGHLPSKATFPVSLRWLLIAGSTHYCTQFVLDVILRSHMGYSE